MHSEAMGKPLIRFALFITQTCLLPTLTDASPRPTPSVSQPFNTWSVTTPPKITTEVLFANAGARLSGTLHLPAIRGPHPVVIVYHGASDPLRTASLYQHLIDLLPPLGIGVFVYDRRDSGASTGPPANGSFELLADDGIAARRILAKDPHVDAKRIGYWGLSQGGWLAALAAQRDPDCAFAVAISAPMTTADVQMRFAVGNIMRIRGYDQRMIDQAVDARLGVDEFMLGKTTRVDAQRRLDKAASQPWFDLIYMGRTFHEPQQSGWAREMSNDPLAVVRQVKAPILILYGSADPWVPVATSMKRLTPIIHEHDNISLHVITGADHAMMTSATPLHQIDPAWTANEAPDATEYLGLLVRWLAQQGLLSPDKPDVR